MSIEEIMEKEGFAASGSGGGCEWYTRPTTHKGKEAFIAITDNGGLDLPKTVEDSIMVGLYDVETGALFEDVKEYDSLKAYLDSTKK
jgi:hypothetical protein